MTMNNADATMELLPMLSKPLPQQPQQEQATIRIKNKPLPQPGAAAPAPAPAPKFNPATKAAPLAPAKPAPIPGTAFVVSFDYEAMGDTEISCKAGDVVVAPPGADLDNEWLYAKNRRTGKQGFIERSFCSYK